MSRKVVVFAGPSLYRSEVNACSSLEDINWRPPVRRGDIEQLLREAPKPGVIGIADGTFHSYPSVGHTEIRAALSSGWKVYGLCSMGAIRAVEMAHLGMRPWGRVAESFMDNPEMPDDEVALVHGVEPPYIPFSEPMIHIRFFLMQMVKMSVLNPSQVIYITSELTNIWFGYRTLARLSAAIEKVVGALPPKTEEAIKCFDQFRLKQIDLSSFVASRPWIVDNQRECHDQC